MSETEGDTGWLEQWQGAKSGVPASTRAEVADARRKTRQLIVLGREITSAIATADGAEHSLSIDTDCVAVANQLDVLRTMYEKGDGKLRDAVAFGVSILEIVAPGVARGGACPNFSGHRIGESTRSILYGADMQGNRIAQLKAP